MLEKQKKSIEVKIEDGNKMNEEIVSKITKNERFLSEISFQISSRS